MGALFLVTVTRRKTSSRGDKPFAKELLLGNQRVGRFYQDTDGNTKFQYKIRRWGRVKPYLYTTETSKATFHALVREAANEQWMNLHFTYVWRGGWKILDRVERVNCDDIVHAWDNAAGDGCYILIENGEFDTTFFQCSHTIAQINATYSASISRSRSPM